MNSECTRGYHSAAAAAHVAMRLSRHRLIRQGKHLHGKIRRDKHRIPHRARRIQSARASRKATFGSKPRPNPAARHAAKTSGRPVTKINSRTAGRSPAAKASARHIAKTNRKRPMPACGKRVARTGTRHTTNPNGSPAATPVMTSAAGRVSLSAGF